MSDLQKFITTLAMHNIRPVVIKYDTCYSVQCRQIELVFSLNGKLIVNYNLGA